MDYRLRAAGRNGRQVVEHHKDFSRHRHFRRTHQTQPTSHTDVSELVHPEHTGSESSYLKSLVDSRAKVTVVLTTGEKLHGRIRYYDRHCISIGLSAKGPRFFVRKENVSYIAEEEQGTSELTEPRPGAGLCSDDGS